MTTLPLQMGSDTRIISWAFAMLHFFLANMVFVLVICFLLFREIGVAAFIGWVFFIGVTGPIQGWVGKLVQTVSKRYDYYDPLLFTAINIDTLWTYGVVDHLWCSDTSCSPMSESSL